MLWWRSDYDAVDQVNISTFGWAGSLSPSGESAFSVCDRYFHSLGFKCECSRSLCVSSKDSKTQRNERFHASKKPAAQT